MSSFNEIFLIIALIFSIYNLNIMEQRLKMPKNYRTVPFSKAEILKSGKTKMFCSKCGMTLPIFYRTNHAANVDGKLK